MHESALELPNNLRLKLFRKLGKFKKILEILGFDSEYPAGHPKEKLLCKNVYFT